MCSGRSTVSSSGLYPYQRTIYSSGGPNPINRSMRSTVYSRLSAAGLLEIGHLWDGYVGTSKAEVGCGFVRLWRVLDKVVSREMAGAWDTLSIETVLYIPFPAMFTVCDYTMITRKNPNVQPSYLFLVPYAKGGCSLFFNAESESLATNPNSCVLNVGVARTQRSLSCLSHYSDS